MPGMERAPPWPAAGPATDRPINRPPHSARKLLHSFIMRSKRPPPRRTTKSGQRLPAQADGARASAPSVERKIATSPFYIVSPSTAEERGALVLKHNDIFAVFDHLGDIATTSRSEEGLYWQGTRFLSQLLLRFYDQRPLFLSSAVKEDNAVLVADLTNPDLLSPQGGVVLQRGDLAPVSFQVS